MRDLDLYDTDDLQEIADKAVAGEAPVLTEDLGHELQNLIKLTNAPIKEFDTTQFGNVVFMDVDYEGCSLVPETEKLVLIFGVARNQIQRRIKFPARLLFGLQELLAEALPEDGV